MAFVLNRDGPRTISLDQATATFIPFAFLVAGSILYAVAQPEVAFARSRFLIWSSFILVTPALALYALDAGRRGLNGYWRLFWTFAFLAYLGHFYVGYVELFRGQLGTVFVSQGWLVAASNFLLTAAWGLDVILSWVTRAAWRPLHVFRLVVTVWVFASFFLSGVVFMGGGSRLIGIVQVAILAVALLVRWLSTYRRERTPI